LGRDYGAAILNGAVTADLRQFDVIVLGGGAAGLMCAATAGQRGRRVALLEHGGQAGRKILISGGGRCNFTNLHCGPQNFISENRHFAKSALALYGPQHFLELVERYGIAWHEKTLGQLFCDGSARAILEMLLAECEVGGVEVVLNARGIEVERDAGGFRVACSQGEFAAGALVVATGGLSIPKMGATGVGYELAGMRRGGWSWRGCRRRWWPGWRRARKGMPRGLMPKIVLLDRCTG
jgi:predicted Rossmann fold flavoprotein